MWMMTTGSRAIPALIAFALFLQGFPAFAGNTFDLLRQDPTARGAALASHPVAMANGDPAAMLSNPAGLAGVSRPTVSITYSDHPLDLSGGQAVYASPLHRGVQAVSVSWFNYGVFDARENLDTPATHSFTPTDLLVAVASAHRLPLGISGGVAAKLIHSRIDTYTSNGIAADLGLMWFEPTHEITLALTLNNAGYQTSAYDGTREPMPTFARAAFAKQLAHLPLMLHLTGHYELDGSLQGSGGGEFTLSPMLKLRAGYTTSASDFAAGSVQDGAAGISAGLGLDLERFHVDYAFISQGALGQVHRIGFGLLLR